ncbi:SCO family protein [Kibdelosporangium philippinense]|uniref:SCO family protein n=1 Tax=Kibdelosporangium philippinense TaxID=211113 RepID=A0ABS8Z9B9_9PSEU|nr:SCO family protein [Kibdelosporangium philippinense]MCE7004127.1 SCO family protein [Kibdelosporangium philippinense]
MTITATFTLTDHDGNPVTAETYHGSWVVVFFGFTHCRMVCPRALTRLSTVLDAVDNPITALYITVDPDRDHPVRMRSFLKDYPHFTGLTGSTEDIDTAKKAFRVFARRKDDPQDPDGYAVPHTAITYLLNPAGQYAAHFLDSHPTDDLITQIRALTG